jgi:hypothetical protein
MEAINLGFAPNTSPYVLYTRKGKL